MAGPPTILEILRNHPKFDPAHGHYEDAPSDEEIYAANSVTFFDMVSLGMLTDTVVNGVVTKSKEEKYQAMCEKAGISGGLTPKDEERMIEINYQRFSARMAKAGVPTGYFDAIVNKSWNPYFDSGGLGAYFHGAPGVGKTYAAVSLIKGWMDEHPYGDPMFVTAPQLVSEMASTYNTGLTKEDVALRYSTCPFLVIDDLGKEERSDASVSRIWRIINERCSNGRPTVITSQLSPSGLLARLSDEDAMSLGSRIKGYYEIRELEGPDRRLADRG